jgi:branched-chain amino acid transport system permease protein
MLLQQLLNGVSLGATYAVFAVGFTLIFGVLNLLNLAQGAVFMWGAFVGLESVRTLGLPLPLAGGVAMLVAGLLGVLSELIVFRPLRHAQASRWMGMVGSLALSRILIALAQEIFGTEVVRYPSGLLRWPAIEVLGARLPSLQVATLFVAVILVICLTSMLRFTQIGRAIRTVAFDGEIARLVGIPVERVTLMTFFLSGALAGAAGVLWSLLFQSVSPFMGETVLLKGLTVLILGGLGNVAGALIGGLLLGVLEVASIVWAGSGYRDAVAFGLVFLILIVRPTGLLRTQASARP